MSNYDVMSADNFAIKELSLAEQEMIQGGILGALAKAGAWVWKHKTTIAFAAYEVYDAVAGDD